MGRGTHYGGRSGKGREVGGQGVENWKTKLTKGKEATLKEGEDGKGKEDQRYEGGR